VPPPLYALPILGSVETKSISYFGIFAIIALHRAVQCILARSGPESKAISPGVSAVLGAASRCSNERGADANAGGGAPWSSAVVYFEMRVRREARGRHRTSAAGYSLQETVVLFLRNEGRMISSGWTSLQARAPCRLRIAGASAYVTAVAARRSKRPSGASEAAYGWS
jgi:hypothetical protein